MFNRSSARNACLGIAIGILACSAMPVAGQIAAPGDVYYMVHADQQFRYYVFAGSFVQWSSLDFAGTSLAASATHDSAFTYGTLGVSSTFAADAGSFTADLDSHITLDAQTGIYHLLSNSLVVDLYVKGATGTPYWISVSKSGQLDVSRLGGAPGSVTLVNGTSSATFGDSTAYVDYTGAKSIAVDDSSFASGLTTAQILVGADTYSFAGTYTFSAPAAVTQAVCVFGCMTAPATFLATATGHVAIQVYPFATPLAVQGPAARAGVVSVEAHPNPLRAAATVSFQALAGERTQVEVFDVNGRRVAKLYEGTALGGTQQVPWQAAGLREGLYFVRIESAGGSSVAKTAVLR